MSEMLSAVLITGKPGVGKTTIVQKLAQDLQKKIESVVGFYTEEVRDDLGTRTGFDVITLEGQRDLLSRTSAGPQDMGLPKVGKYSVYIEKFERLALPIVQQPANILIIDEIGKMELISKKFENEILQLIKDLENNRRCLIATIPSRSTLRTVDSLKSLRTAKIFEITKSNRNSIYETILKYSLDLIQK